MTELIKLHTRLGLHQDLTIYYVVDGYIAVLNDDQSDPIISIDSEPCETIYLALLDLEGKL